jgi:hypothetical protein
MDMTQMVTKQTASEALAMISTFGDAASAAHQGRVQLTAIRPYSDARLERTIAVLDQIAARDNDRQAKLIGQLEQIAKVVR